MTVGFSVFIQSEYRKNMGKFKGTFRERPWLGEEVIRTLEGFLTPKSLVLETGAGSSTLWLADRVFSMISFEHKLAWYEAVIAELRSRERKNALVIYSIDYPKDGVPHWLEIKFDLILIDGRGRVQSVKTAYKMLRPGGLLLLDNANRPRYQAARDFLADLGWKMWNVEDRVQPENKRSFATFWRRPSE